MLENNRIKCPICGKHIWHSICSHCGTDIKKVISELISKGVNVRWMKNKKKNIMKKHVKQVVL